MKQTPEVFQFSINQLVVVKKTILEQKYEERDSNEWACENCCGTADFHFLKVMSYTSRDLKKKFDEILHSGKP